MGLRGESCSSQDAFGSDILLADPRPWATHTKQRRPILLGIWLKAQAPTFPSDLHGYVEVRPSATTEQRAELRMIPQMGNDNPDFAWLRKVREIIKRALKRQNGGEHREYRLVEPTDDSTIEVAGKDYFIIGQDDCGNYLGMESGTDYVVELRHESNGIKTLGKLEDVLG